MTGAEGRSGGCALITGAAGGIGLAAARALGRQGLALFLVDLDADGLARASNELTAAGVRVHHQVTDVMVTAEVNAVVEAARAFGRIDVLVNVAGGSGPKPVRDIEGITDEDWDFVVDLNLKSTFLFCRAVVPFMRAQGYGRIVNTSSSYAWGRKGPVTTQGTRLAYAAAKAGLLGFTAQLAKDLAEVGITVNVVVPALTLGEPGSRIRSRFEKLDPAARENVLRELPMGRPAEAHEVASAIAYLASEGASYTTGIALPVDGAV
jgi:NAD(P)-dependent dehydrogenase (short-subunit alcohol dehydrogenase family)